MPPFEIKKTTYLLTFYLIATLIIFVWITLPVIYGEEETIQLWADSMTYHKIFSLGLSLDELTLISFD